MLPQRSGVHEISSPSWKKSEPDPVLETARLVDVERLLVPPEPETVRALVAPLPPPDRVYPNPTVTVGNNEARVSRTSALACRYAASACARFWLEMLTRASSASSCGSPNAFHQSPRSVSSLG